MKNKGTLDNSSINSLITQSLLSLEKAGVTKDDRLRFGLSIVMKKDAQGGMY